MQGSQVHFLYFHRLSQVVGALHLYQHAHRIRKPFWVVLKRTRIAYLVRDAARVDEKPVQTLPAMWWPIGHATSLNQCSEQYNPKKRWL